MAGVCLSGAEGSCTLLASLLRGASDPGTCGRLARLLEPRLAKGGPPRRSEQSLLLVWVMAKGGSGEKPAKHDDGRERTFRLVCKLLGGITASNLQRSSWSDLFDSGFIKVLFKELLKSMDSQAVVSILVDLLGQFVASLRESASPGDGLISAARVLLEVVAESDAFQWTEFPIQLDRLLIASLASIAFANVVPDPQAGLLVSSAFRASLTVLRQAAKLKTQIGMSNQLADAAISFLTLSDSGGLQHRREALCLLSECAVLDPTLFDKSLALSLSFVNNLESLKRLESASISALQIESNNNNVLSEMAAVSEVLQCLLASATSANKRLEVVQKMIISMAHTCLFAHLNGGYFFTDIKGQSSFPTAELTSFTLLAFEMLTEDLTEVGFPESRAKWMIITALEYCTELLNEHAAVQTLTTSAASRGCLARLLSFIGHSTVVVAPSVLVGSVFHSLVELLSHSSASAFVADIARQIILISSRNLELMDLAEEAFCATFAHTFGGAMSHQASAALANHPTQVSESVLGMLEGISAGLNSIVQFLIESKDASRLLRMRGKLTILFERMVAEEYVYPRLVQNMGKGLGFLLRPIATAFSPLAIMRLASTESRQEDYAAPAFRTFWYALLTFRLSERDCWNSMPEWLEAFQKIATHSPPLLLGDLLESDLSSCPFLQTLISNGTHIDLASVLPQAANFKAASLSFPHLMYGVTCQYLESLRVGASLEVRPILSYLDNDFLDSSTIWLKATSISLADTVFTTWLDSTSEQLDGGAFWRVKSTVGQVLEFFVGQCAHRRSLVRLTARKFVRLALERFSWLMFSPTSVFVLLDSIQTLSMHSQLLSRRETNASECARVDGSLQRLFCLVAIDPNESDSNRLSNVQTSLTHSLPNDSESAAEANQDLFVLSYDWFAKAALHTPLEIDSLVQEYLLLDHVKDISSHAGVSVAMSFITPSTRPLVNPASRFSCAGTATSTGTSRCIDASACFRLETTGASELELKSRYIGEIIGMIQTDAHLESVPSQASQYAVLAEMLYTDLSVQLSGSDAPKLIVDALWRCMALIHNACLLLVRRSSPLVALASEIEEQRLWEWVHHLLHLISSCGVRRFDIFVVEALVSGWRWLFISFPRLQNRILYESASGLLSTCHAHLGMFSSLSTAGAKEHIIWISFLLQRISTVAGDDVCGVFIMVDSIISSGDFKRVQSLTPRFLLLSLGFKCLEASSQQDIQGRRALREKIYNAAFSWFESSTELHTPVDCSFVKEGVETLQNFYSLVVADALTWGEEYSMGKVAMEGENLQQFRAAGHEAALILLQNCVGELVDSPQVCDGVFKSSQQDLGISSQLRSAISASLCLLKMLLLHEIDRLRGWIVGFKSMKLLANRAAKKYSDTFAAMSNIRNYKQAIKASWCVSPGLAMTLASLYPKLEARDGSRKGLSHLQLFTTLSSRVPNLRAAAAAPLLVDCAKMLSSDRAGNLGTSAWTIGSSKFPALKTLGLDASLLAAKCLERLLFCTESSTFVALKLLSRLEIGVSSSQPVAFVPNSLHRSTEISRFALRCLKAAESATLLNALPQLIQLCRRDEFGAIRELLREQCAQSASFCNSAMLTFMAENDNGPESSTCAISHGYCKTLSGPDSLPAKVSLLIHEIRTSLNPRAIDMLDANVAYWHSFLNVSSNLRHEPDKQKHKQIIVESAKDMKDGGEAAIHIPSDPSRRIVGVDTNSGTPMRSAARSPFAITFMTTAWEGPDNFLLDSSTTTTTTSNKKRILVLRKFSSPDAKQKSNPRRLSLAWPPLAPSPIKELSMQTIDDDDDDDDYANGEQDFASNTCTSFIFKAFDDVRQDALVIQVMRILRDEFSRAGLPLVLIPYSVVPARVAHDFGGIIEMVPRAKSRDSLGSSGEGKTLLELFSHRFGPPSSAAFEKAQSSFAASLAGYAVVCYLLQIKDRHNGNVLLDTEGHIIHIDFGFLLGTSPANNMGFEAAPFKLTDEMISLLGGEDGDKYEQFVGMTVQGFLAARNVVEPILSTVTALADSGLPCFSHRMDTLSALRTRFAPDLSTSAAADYMLHLVKSAKRAWTTRAYDWVQHRQNGVYAPEWT